MRKNSRVSRSNSSAAAYQRTDFRCNTAAPIPGPKSSTAPCTPATPGISPVLSRAGSVSNNIPDIVPQVIFII
jgi:phosphatidylinositol-4-phosphate 3-kinase